MNDMRKLMEALDNIAEETTGDGFVIFNTEMNKYSTGSGSWRNELIHAKIYQAKDRADFMISRMSGKFAK